MCTANSVAYQIFTKPGISINWLYWSYTVA